MNEPIKDGGELDEGEVGQGEFLITSADAAVAFDATKEVFDAVTPTVVAAMESRGLAARAFGGKGGQKGSRLKGVLPKVGFPVGE